LQTDHAVGILHDSVIEFQFVHLLQISLILLLLLFEPFFI
jgi:hypothetical protein